MNILYTAEFQKQFHKLPEDIQTLYRRQEILFQTNWRDPRLHTKKLVRQLNTFSFRVTRLYRVLFLFDSRDTVVFLTIAHRKDAYRFATHHVGCMVRSDDRKSPPRSAWLLGR